MDPDVLHYMQILNMYKGLMVSVKLGSMDPDVLHYMQILNMYKGLMVSVKLGSMDPDVLHYMQILNRYKGPSDGKCKIRVDGPRCFTLHANFE